MSEFLVVEKISKRFQPDKEVTVRALDTINLVIREGEFVVISGPSGSGKTTLLNIIGGLDLPSDGKIFLDGIELTHLSETDLSRIRRDHIGFVFQAYNLLPVFTARENIEYVMKLQGMDNEKCASRSLAIAEKLGIETLLDKLPHQLSGGQQQRVAVARAVASTPKLVLADEPTANLDSKTAVSLIDMMEKLNRDEGVTIIFSSHDPMVIAKARRSVVLKDGKLVSNVCEE
ncbi:ABC-type antimicrobial peptide transport system, ATPase component [Desulfocapsa sulfexigens DSM 10523]|uniref:ABC-type antimicrobial peptide transport system, ATPase component n=1 Tax=Desulfocapsa sulfexigens (strain DSM 10523 / SB164P1) TaxID=1167006 RepID=M1P8L7_DESSD|nr:ABC transporter ATP-binding protein [Desulfocapsa sulfexigens]AGF79828.1 ABC-type antimicrobial peptide transport system, ATPase component [Desulfocapsa sulfexigens DSM 10523]